MKTASTPDPLALPERPPSPMPDGPLERLPQLIAFLGLGAAFYFAVTMPLTLGWQSAAGIIAFLFASYAGKRGGRRVSLLLMMLSMVFSTRYLYWRISYSLPTGNDASAADIFFATGLLLAEIYAYTVLVLGYFQASWPLNRKPVALPRDSSEWPTVDIYIPTYNEPLKVVRATVLAARDIDWPQDKIRIYVLDDGRRDEFRDFCREVGITHITRPDNKHAKAGNINHALKLTGGEFVAIFDCDHIPTRSFLQMTMGTIVADPRIALIQTPHHFFSPDPFERNLRIFRKVPNEGELFYGLLQDGNDYWNASFFCGSCAVLRRSAMAEIGGIAVETVTEDAHTALRLHSRGWHSAYIAVPQAAGLATESLSAHIGQRIRWARGMAQILRVDNPLLKPGLAFGQRICYLNAMLHFLYGIPRLVFLTSPLAFLLLGCNFIKAQGLMIFAYAAPHVLIALATNSRLQGQFRHSFWAEVYETVLAIFIIVPTTLALVNPKLGKFNVTAKGGIVDRDYFDGDIAKPYYFLFLLNMLGVAAGLIRFGLGGWVWDDTIALNMVWTVYNLLILGAALSVAGETRQLRHDVRVSTSLPARVRLPGGTSVKTAKTIDLSSGGCLLQMDEQPFATGDTVEVSLLSADDGIWLPAVARRADARRLALDFEALDVAQESQLVYALFGRGNAWLDWRSADRRDRPLRALGAVARFSVIGSRQFFRWFIKQGGQTMLQLFRRQGTAASLIVALVLMSAPDARAEPDAASAAIAAATAAAAPKPTSRNAFSESQLKLGFEDLGQRYPMRLTTVFGEASVPLSVRRDQVVTSAKLHLLYSHSPSLLPALSHLNVLVNNEIAKTIPFEADSASGTERVIELNPLLFGEFNRIGFQAVQHYTNAPDQCENPTHSSLWSVISNRSYIEVQFAPLSVSPSLERLPRPFFDAGDTRMLDLPFAFADATPGKGSLRAAAILASWFGAQADYRGARFPVSIGSLPEGYAVVFRSGNAMSGQFGPPPPGPRLRIVSGSTPGAAAQLLIEAPDDEGLVLAAQALALGAYATGGSSADIQSVDLPAPVPHDAAPRWMNPEHPIAFKDLTDDALTVRGLTPGPLNLEFRLPPDLYFTGSEGAILELRYRHSPTTVEGSSLSVLLNTAYLSGLMFDQDQKVGLTGKIGGLFKTQESARRDDLQVARLKLPASRFASSNQLTLQYEFRRDVTKPCEDFNVQSLGGSIDPDSTLRFENFTHYALWPNLERFRDGGLPFSTAPDLAETVFLLPERLDPDAIGAMLIVAGHLDRVTGMAGVHVAVDTIGAGAAFPDRHMVLIGRGSELPDAPGWSDQLPLRFSDRGAELRSYGLFSNFQAWVEGRDLSGALGYAGRVLSTARHDVGALIGTTSPFGRGRAAVIVVADSGASLSGVAESIIDPARNQFIKGDLSLVSGRNVSGYQLETQYGIGRLPYLVALRRWFGLHPYLMLPITFAFAGIAAWLLFGLLRRGAERRLRPAQKDG